MKNNRSAECIGNLPIMPVIVSESELKHNPYASIDKKMNFLDSLNLDTFAKLTRVKTQQFSTFTSRDIESVEILRPAAATASTLIPYDAM